MKRNLCRRGRLATLLGMALLLSGCPDPMTDLQKHSQDGTDYFSSGDYEEAEVEFTKAVELGPGEAGLLMNRANARMMLGREDEAMADYDAALAIDSKFALGYANRGILRDRRGDTEGAITDYRQALELDPELGDGPSIWQRIIKDPPRETIRDRLLYLMSQQQAGGPAPAPRQ